ncbi:MAG: carboxypeptidase-like regulatory domain-containing protein [Armatimonadetes bacterium]|nr:carboxypeptidase-like regulatory domain-containing protein [Armatimonadota bacterium]
MALRVGVAVALCGALGLGLAGCGGGGEAALALVTGQVVDDGSLQGIANATVRIGAARDDTAADGTFIINDAPTGTQTLSITAAGHEAYQQGVSLAGGTNTLGLLYLPPTLAAGTGAITGTLVLSNGSRVEDGVVRSGAVSARSRSDGTGRFTLYSVPPGTPQVTFIDPVSGESAWRYITVTAGGLADVGQVRLSSGPPPPPL